MQNRIRRQKDYVEDLEEAYVLLRRNGGGVHGFRGGVLEHRIDHLLHQDLSFRVIEGSHFLLVELTIQRLTRRALRILEGMENEQKPTIVTQLAQAIDKQQFETNRSNRIDPQRPFRPETTQTYCIGSNRSSDESSR